MKGTEAEELRPTLYQASQKISSCPAPGLQQEKCKEHVPKGCDVRNNKHFGGAEKLQGIQPNELQWNYITVQSIISLSIL